MADDHEAHARSKRTELAAFLKSRRARLQPSDVGLRGGGRRRVAGLRREEVAAVADVGLTWYTALETGSEIGVSENTLERIADALKLDSAERTYLLELARGIPAKVESAVSARVREAIDAVEAPAYVISGDWNILYWNVAFAALWNAEPPGSAPFNAAESLFIDPGSRKLYAEAWESVARGVVAQIRSDYASHIGDPVFEKTMSRLLTIPDFERFYAANEVISSMDETVRTIQHPALGPIEIVSVNFLIPGTSLTATIELLQEGAMDRLRSYLRAKEG